MEGVESRGDMHFRSICSIHWLHSESLRAAVWLPMWRRDSCTRILKGTKGRLYPKQHYQQQQHRAKLSNLTAHSFSAGSPFEDAAGWPNKMCHSCTLGFRWTMCSVKGYKINYLQNAIAIPRREEGRVAKNRQFV